MTYACPCCNNLPLSEQPPGTYEVCPVCYWEDDPIQYTDDEYEGGANSVSLRAARENYLQFGACSEDVRSEVRKPKADEVPQR